MRNIDFNKQFCIPVRESTENQMKHLVVKSMICLAIKLKYARSLNYQKVYPEFDLDGAVPDVWHENWKEKSCLGYELQDNVTKKWITLKNKFYNNYTQAGFKIDWILVDLNKLSDDLEILWKQIKEIIV